MKNHHTHLARVLVVAVLIATTVIQPFFAANAAAGQITNRRLTLMAGATDGGSMISGVVNHFFEFTVPSTATAIGSIQFEYCTTAADSLAVPACVTPSGLDTTLAGTSLGSEAGSGASGFTLNKTTQGKPYLTKAAPAAPSSGDLKFRLDGIMNPDTEGTFYVRIKTFTGANLGGTNTDAGTVAASTAEQIVLTGIMPESLVFCVGADVLKTAGVPDCTTATGGAISFDQLFSPTSTASAVSRMVASTNAGAGYIITVNGPTLTSGSNTIAGIAAPAASQTGIAQFGLNLRANTIAAAPGFPGVSPTDSRDIDSPSNFALNLNGRPTPDYALPDTFKFVSGDIVADSNFNTAGNPDASDAQIYTVSYIANVPGSQPAGTYVSTLTYICTPTY
jgi:hypothetical protein